MVIIIWLCVFPWGRPKGDWDTAMAFGQLIAVSASILFWHAKEWGRRCDLVYADYLPGIILQFLAT